MARKVIHGTTYSVQYDQLKISYPRLPDIQAGVDWALYTNAEQLESVTPDGSYRIIKTEGVDEKTPGFRMLAKLSHDGECDVAELIAIDVLPASET